MTVKLKKIGNSKGLIIPKKLIEMCGLDDEVFMTVEDGHIIISSAEAPRAGWEKQFEKANAGKSIDNEVIDHISNDFDETEWTW